MEDEVFDPEKVDRFSSLDIGMSEQRLREKDYVSNEDYDKLLALYRAKCAEEARASL